MKSSTNVNIILFALLGIFMIAGSISVGKVVYGQQTLDIKTPGGNEAFGGENKGTFTIVPKEHLVNIVANMTLLLKKARSLRDGWQTLVAQTIN
jgi:hypothetical protein